MAQSHRSQTGADPTVAVSHWRGFGLGLSDSESIGRSAVSVCLSTNRRYLVSALGQVVFELVLERLHVGLERIVRLLQAEYGVVGDSRLDRRRPSARSTVVLTQYALGYVCSANGIQPRMLFTLETHSYGAWSVLYSKWHVVCTILLRHTPML